LQFCFLHFDFLISTFLACSAVLFYYSHKDGGGLAAEKLGEVVNQHPFNFIQRFYTETI